MIAAVGGVIGAAASGPVFDLTTYYPIFLYLVACLLIPIGALIGSHLFSPRKNTPVKLMPYESGMDPIGDTRQRFDIKFYLVAILFLVFDVELLFLYPWAVMAYGPDADPSWRPIFGRIAFLEVLVFLATLTVAYVYAWRKGVFEWR
jgi:NADH:ubiquinone oxidoreductase subunit 3 (subunit A)